FNLRLLRGFNVLLNFKVVLAPRNDGRDCHGTCKDWFLIYGLLYVPRNDGYHRSASLRGGSRMPLVQIKVLADEAISLGVQSLTGDCRGTGEGGFLIYGHLSAAREDG